MKTANMEIVNQYLSALRLMIANDDAGIQDLSNQLAADKAVSAIDMKTIASEFAGAPKRLSKKAAWFHIQKKVRLHVINR